LLTSSQCLLLRWAYQSLDLLTSLLVNLVNFFAPLLGSKRRVAAYRLNLDSIALLDVSALLHRRLRDASLLPAGLLTRMQAGWNPYRRRSLCHKRRGHEEKQRHQCAAR
jgi:hypothetical protein